MEKKILIEEGIGTACPDYAMIYIEATVRNGESTEEVRAAMHGLAEEISSKYRIEDINKRPAIAATRAAYKACGKDPNRYRPSQEQLMRRVVRGLGLYNVNTLVDTGNILSLKTGCSVGIFDRDRIEGDEITLGVGREGEPYEGIGRGELNIAGLPVIRDAVGGFGTPTSDNERTKTTLDTQRIAVTIHVFDSSQENLDGIRDLAIDLLTTYCEAVDVEWEIVSNL